MGRPIVHFEIAAKNSEKLRDFYTQLFDWRIEPQEQMQYTLVYTGRADSVGIDGGIMEATDMPAYMTVYVHVESVDESLEKAKGLGATTVVPPTPIPGVGRFALFTDPVGTLMGVIEDEKPQ